MSTWGGNETYTCEQEFELHDECNIPVVGRVVLQWITLVCSIVCLLGGITILLYRYNTIWKKPVKTRILFGLIIMVFILIILRTALTLTITVTSRQSLWMYFIVSIMASMAISTAIWYVHMQLDLVVQLTLGHGNDSFMLLHRNVFQTVFAVIAILAFLCGPVISYVTGINPGTMFWGAVVFGDMIIPYFSYLGFHMSQEMKRSKHSKYRDLGRQIFISSVVCGLIGTSTGIAAIFSLVYHGIEWIIFELCWSSAACFYFILLLIFVRRLLASYVKTTTSNSADSTPSGSAIVSTVSRTMLQPSTNTSSCESPIVIVVGV